MSPILVLLRTLNGRLSAWAASLGGNTIGSLFVLVSSVAVVAQMSAIKELGDAYPPWQVLLARTGGQLAMLLPFMARNRWNMLRTRAFGWHLVRTLSAYLGILGWFYSIAHMRLADAMGISFTKGLFLVALAAAFLHERPGVVGWAATIVGFFGVLVMVGPTGDSGFETAALAGLCGAAGGAVTTIAVKYLTRTESNATIMAYPAMGLTILAAIPSWYTWVPVTPEAAPLFGLAIVSGIVTQWCFISAYRHGEASVLATVEYVRVVTAALAGYLVFGEVPTPTAFLGILLIVLASLVSVRRERIRAWIFH